MIGVRLSPISLISLISLIFLTSLLGACVEVEIVKLPGGETGTEAAKGCKEQAAKAGNDRFQLEGSCLALVPGARVETITFQPGNPPPRPAGCALLSVDRGRTSERWTYTCGQ